MDHLGANAVDRDITRSGAAIEIWPRARITHTTSSILTVILAYVQLTIRLQLSILRARSVLLQGCAYSNRANRNQRTSASILISSAALSRYSPRHAERAPRRLFVRPNFASLRRGHWKRFGRHMADVSCLGVPPPFSP